MREPGRAFCLAALVSFRCSGLWQHGVPESQDRAVPILRRNQLAVVEQSVLDQLVPAAVGDTCRRAVILDSWGGAANDQPMTCARQRHVKQAVIFMPGGFVRASAGLRHGLGIGRLGASPDQPCV